MASDTTGLEDDRKLTSSPSGLEPLGLLYQIVPYLRPYWRLCAGIVTLTMLQVAYFLIFPVAFRRLFDIHLRVFQQLQTLPYHYYGQTPSGTLSSRFTTDLAAADFAIPRPSSISNRA